MINVFKSMCYRIITNRVTYYSMFLAVALPFLLVISAISATGESTTILGVIDSITLLGMVVVFVPISLFICNDYSNKTLYYEVMNGHSRFDVYTGRTLAVVLLGFVIYNIQLFVTLLMSSVFMNYQLAGEGVTTAVCKIVCVELCVLGYLLFFSFTALALKNIIISISVNWFGLIGSCLVAQWDEHLVTDSGDAISSIFGSGVIRCALANKFSESAFTMAVLIAIALIIVFYLLGLYIFKKSEFY